MPTIYNVRLESTYVEVSPGVQERRQYPKLHQTEARETAKLYKLDGKNSAFGWAINLPKEERYMTPVLAWAFWLAGIQGNIDYHEESLKHNLNLRDMGVQELEKVRDGK